MSIIAGRNGTNGHFHSRVNINNAIINSVARWGAQVMRRLRGHQAHNEFRIDRTTLSLSLSFSTCMLAAITRPLYQVHCPDRLLNKPRTPSFQDLIVIYGYSFPPPVLVSSFDPCPSLGGILSSPLELFAVEGREIRPCHL